MYDAKTLIVSMSWRRRRLSTSSVSSSPSLTSRLVLGALALGASPSWCAPSARPRRWPRPAASMSSAMIAPSDLAHVGAALALLA